jgi:cell division protein FtsI (penicillin-binding protein 3)
LKNRKKQRTGNTGHDRRIPENPRRAGRGRYIFVKFIFIAAFLVILGRLFQIQVIEGSEYRDIARRQYESQTELPASRGLVYDRNGNILISNTQFISFAADPLLIGDKANELARVFSGVFGKPSAFYHQKLRDGKRFVWLERRVSPEHINRIDTKKFRGLIVINEPKRLYHYGDLAGELLGKTDIDNTGIAGIELQFDGRLHGKSGYVIMQRDGLMRTYPTVDYPRVEPLNGNNFVLTLDLPLQSIAEEELRRGIERNNAESGLAVIMDPKTGAILAMVNHPTMERNRIITDMFEPGSVFKIVTVSSALENNLRRGDDRFYAENGEYRVPISNRRVRTIRDSEKYEWLTFREAMQFSSNIVMAKVSDEIGAERFYKTARDYGFGIPTGIELPGEVRGDLKKPVNWSGTTLNTMAYGYEVGVTPLQLISAYAAIANGGVLMKPYIVRQELDNLGKTIHEVRPQEIRKVISKATADTLISFLESVVTDGSGRNAAVSGVRVAGKTGTARKHVDGRYSTRDYTASFVGMFPVEDPAIVILVMMDNPRTGGYYASGTSAPVFKRIAERIISTGLMRLPPPQPRGILAEDIHIRQNEGRIQTVLHAEEISGSRVPDVRNIPVQVAREILSRSGFMVDAGETGIVGSQAPAAGVRAESGTTVQLELIEPPGDDDGDVIVPDLTGLTVRGALNRAVAGGLSVEISGSGLVSEQVPRPGRSVPRGTVIRIECKPKLTGVQLVSQ